MKRIAINTGHAPAAIGTYSQAIKTDGLVFVSGQIPLDPESGELVGEHDVELQIRQVFDNLKAVAEGAGTSLNNAAKITVFLTDLSHFGQVNEIMTEYFEKPYPARAALEVSALPRGATVEADAILIV
ncbi:MAG: Rid family detoxifying hydrolase [Gammaproteobacteria bacterium]|nr:Rid family detoxifying hydrolase [Gammaproteobacteria bacterium]